MPPKKKKAAPKNSFYFYMIDFKRKREAEGFTFPGGLQEVAELASPSWKGLDPKSKQHFENLAERDKVSGNRGVRYTAQGRTYEDVDREKRELERKKVEMINTITMTIRADGREGLKQRNFYFIHVNYYCQKDNHQFVPCELSVLAYNVEKGYVPKNLYHTFIDPGPIPNGYTFRAISHSEDTHKTPLPPNSQGSKQYKQIFDNILILMEQNGDMEDDDRPPPMYTLTQCMPEVVDTLDHLKDYALYPTEGFFRVFPMEELFFQMKNFGLKPEGQHLFFNGVEDNGFPFLANAADVLRNDIYDYSSGIACEYHDDQDVRQHCSKSYVIRWSYLFSDNLCANLDVKIISGRHTPRGTNLNAVEITSQMDHMKLSQEPLQSCGRGKPVDGRSARTSRTTISQAVTRNPTPSSRTASYAGSECSYASASGCSTDLGTKGGDASDKPFTIIDHGQLQASNSIVPQAPKPVPSDAPLRQPKAKGKFSIVNAVQNPAAPVYDGSNFPTLSMAPAAASALGGRSRPRVLPPSDVMGYGRAGRGLTCEPRFPSGDPRGPDMLGRNADDSDDEQFFDG